MLSGLMLWHHKGEQVFKSKKKSLLHWLLWLCRRRRRRRRRRVQICLLKRLGHLAYVGTSIINTSVHFLHKNKQALLSLQQQLASLPYARETLQGATPLPHYMPYTQASFVCPRGEGKFGLACALRHPLLLFYFRSVCLRGEGKFELACALRHPLLRHWQRQLQTLFRV